MTIKNFLLPLVLAGIPMTAIAQGAPPAPPVAPAAAPEPVDPARLAAAKPVIDQIWPLGTYARIMHAVMDQMYGATMASMYDMPVDDFVKGVDPKAKPTGKTFREVMAETDPYYEERSKRVMKVMTDEMIGLMNEIEPDVRVALANAYARKFTVAQLNDLHTFFETPTGQIYARDSMMMMMGPDMMQALQAMMPKMMQRMPAIMEKVKEATKDLPLPSRPKKKA